MIKLSNRITQFFECMNWLRKRMPGYVFALSLVLIVVIVGIASNSLSVALPDENLPATMEENPAPTVEEPTAIKDNWYAANSPNSGGSIEWVYSGATASRAAKPVTNWSELQDALATVSAYVPTVTDGNEQPHVIYISDDITMGAMYTITGKNIILRKWDSNSERKLELLYIC